MKKKILFLLAIVAVLIAVGAAAFGYFRILADEQRIVDNALNENSPSIALGTLDGAYIAEIRLLAIAGNTSALTVLGARYQYGLGLPVNPTLMLRNYHAAAQKGAPTAQLMLGRLYDPYRFYDFMTIIYTESSVYDVIKSESGEILLKTDSSDAKSWYRRAADQGNSSAMVMLGMLYEKEERMADSNIVTAAKWFQRAAECGNREGQLRIGQMYVGDYGVSKDEDKGIAWLKKAAAQGSVEAELDLGMEYENGHAMIRDSQNAAKWYLLAAQHGNPFAQRNIGLFYAKGVGVPRDYVAAYLWLNKAAAQGAPYAAEARDVLESIMTPSQLEKAQLKVLKNDG
jgi:hypothetical protein